MVDSLAHLSITLFL